MAAGGRPVRHIVWDWNGTLLDDLPAVVSATNDVLDAWGQPLIDLNRYREKFFRPVRAFNELLLGRPVDDEEWVRIDETFHDSYRKRLPGCALASDARVALDLVHDLGLSQSLLSMWRHEDLTEWLPFWDLDGRFSRIDGDRLRRGETKAAALREHLRALALAPGEAVLIGDTVDDARAARSAGVSCVLVTQGSCQTSEALHAEGPATHNLMEAVALVRDLPATAPHPSHDREIADWRRESLDGVQET